jgi:hypothetical protein
LAKIGLNSGPVVVDNVPLPSATTTLPSLKPSTSPRGSKVCLVITAAALSPD